MISFQEIDARLEGIGKDRAWLAENTPYSAAYLRDLMAPKSTRRTERVQQIISDAIEKEEVSQRSTARLPDQLALAPTPEEFDAWCRAYKASPAETLKDWAIDELNKAAAAWAESKIIGMPAKTRILAPAAETIVAFPETPLLHAAAGSPITTDGETFTPTRQLGPGRFACQLHGDSMSPRFPDGSIVILRERGSLKRPVLKTGEIYLFDVGGEKTLKSYGSRKAKPAEIQSGISYQSTEDGKPKVRVLKSINPAYPEIVVTEEVDWLGWLDKEDNR